MNMNEFNREIKRRCLDDKVLSDEYHDHSYNCVEHYHPSTAIVHGLFKKLKRTKINFLISITQT